MLYIKNTALIAVFLLCKNQVAKVVEGLLSLKEVYKSGMILLVLGCLIGLFLSYKRGSIILTFGIIGAICWYFYTEKPLKFKYRCYDFRAINDTWILLSTNAEFTLKALLISIPMGLLTTAILHVNDIRDMEYDKRAGIKTLSIWIGNKNAQIIYFSLIIFSYISLLIMIFYNYVPYLSLICLLTLPSAVKNINKLRIARGLSDNIIELDKETGKLQGKFGVLFILSILLILC